jgi:hypothetical protein
MTNEEIVRRYAAAQIEGDFDAAGALRHPEWTAHWPQSGEIVHGPENVRAIVENYPGGAPRLMKERRLVGIEDRWVSSPVGGAYRIAGEGETWWGEWTMLYPDGREWLTTILIELRDGKVWRETQYWAEPFDAPEWRAKWVEKAPPA